MERLILLNTIADTEQLEALAEGSNISSVTTAQNGERLSDLIGDANSIILADRRFLTTHSTLSDLLQPETKASAVLFQIQFGEELSTLDKLNADGVISALTAAGHMPAMMIKVPAELLKESEETILDDGRETIMRLYISAVASDIAIELSAECIQADANSAEMSCDLDGATRSRLLSYAVGSINIEDLFPNHAWDAHEEESAAACFHTLAAHFIRYGDLQAADECLSFSERLEESPRALALRALISKKNGETLGAVANMVSSLQGYESRKRDKADANSHYITFSPSDLEVINTSLHDGLSALNKQDNDTAFSHFAKAVYNFDSFFNSIGLSTIEQ